MRVPYAQFLGKVPFKAVVIVLGAGAAAAAGFAALSWTAKKSIADCVESTAGSLLAAVDSLLRAQGLG